MATQRAIQYQETVAAKVQLVEICFQDPEFTRQMTERLIAWLNEYPPVVVIYWRKFWDKF